MNRRNNTRGVRTESNEQQPEQQQQQQQQPVNNQSQDNNGMAVDATSDSEGGIGAKMRKIFDRKSLTSADRKRLAKDRKNRQLRRLRKLLSPKNAIVALHEIQGTKMGEFVINTDGQKTTAEIVVNNVRYEATANSKHQAKVQAAEKAIRDLVIAQMAKTSNNVETKVNNENNGNDSGDIEMTEVAEQDDGVPILHLASFALHRLFKEWQYEGFEIPAFKNFLKNPLKGKQNGVDSTIQPKVAKTPADLPADAASRHPAGLLSYMRPHIVYQNLGISNPNDPAIREFTVGVTVDGQNFVGKGRSKKLARKEVAAVACRALFNVEFIEPKVEPKVEPMVEPMVEQPATA